MDDNYTSSALHSGIFLGDLTERVEAAEDMDHRNEAWNPTHTSPGAQVKSSDETDADNVSKWDNISTHSSRKWWNNCMSTGFYGKQIPSSPLANTQNMDSVDLERLSPNSRGFSLGTCVNSRHTPRDSFTSTAFKTSAPVMMGPTRPGHVYYAANRGRDSFEGVNDSNITRSMRRRSSGTNGFSSELPLGSFVGSYEESILNGRMSTTPSKPFMFVAKIGVLGIGKCKSTLRCPPHITLPFPAYFYSVSDYDSPSPYVGQIDLDNALEICDKRFPQGGYRLPPQGQIQLVIKNPNKTAVKLFLVPYDLRDMQPGSKTFVRQKCFATTENLAEDPPHQSECSSAVKQSLRYLVHLHFCCPWKGRYYLYRNIRVVFANRVPDGKEKLRNENMIPEPKYSAWKPSHERRWSAPSQSEHIRKGLLTPDESSVAT